MHKILFYCLWFATMVVTTATVASNARLQDGTPIVIDDNSRNVYVLQGNVRRPLWGGVHRLDNGSSVTVNGGILINEFRSTEETRAIRHIAPGSPSPCQILLNQACGTANKCATHPGCLAARQLLQMEEQERHPGDPTVITPTSESCAEAVTDVAYFTPCPQL